MGIFDFLKKNKVKRLEPPKKVRYNGKSDVVEFDPYSDWDVKDEDTKNSQIKIYNLNNEVLINMEIPNEDESAIEEFNLIRYETRHDETVDGYAKKVKDLVINILDCQSKISNAKDRSAAVINNWIKLDSLLKFRAVNAELSNEGKAILRNVQGEKVSVNRTIDLERDANGYLQKRMIKDDLKLIKKVISLDKSESSINSTTKIEVPIQKLDEEKYGENDLTDFLKGYIALCKLGNTIGIAERVVPWEYGVVDEAYKILAKTDLGEGIEDISEPQNKELMKKRVEQEIVEKSLYLENMIERYVYNTSIGQGVKQDDVKDSVLKNIDDDEKENAKLVTTMLEYSKVKLTKKMISKTKEKEIEQDQKKVEEEQKGISYDEYEVEDLVKLIGVINNEEARKKIPDKQLLEIANGARAELKRRAEIRRNENKTDVKENRDLTNEENNLDDEENQL